MVMCNQLIQNGFCQNDNRQRSYRLTCSFQFILNSNETNPDNIEVEIIQRSQIPNGEVLDRQIHLLNDSKWTKFDLSYNQYFEMLVYDSKVVRRQIYFDLSLNEKGNTENVTEEMEFQIDLSHNHDSDFKVVPYKVLLKNDNENFRYGRFENEKILFVGRVTSKWKDLVPETKLELCLGVDTALASRNQGLEFTTTDGRFEFDLLRDSVYTLHVSKNGFDSRSILLDTRLPKEQSIYRIPKFEFEIDIESSETRKKMYSTTPVIVEFNTEREQFYFELR